MRKVVKDFDDKPLSLTKQETLNHLKIILESRNVKKIINSDFYNGKYDKPDGKKGSDVLEKLAKLYKGKCAYCESHSETCIEHYRPKGRVLRSKHGGYFWLCYEWSNLLPACHNCNELIKGKGIQFPVKNSHTKFDACLVNQNLDSTKIQATYLNQIEEPYLLHPEIDEPNNFLGFKIANKNEGIALIGLDGINARGEQTVKICNLNRDSLLISRQDIITEFIKKIDLALNFCKKNSLNLEATITTIHIVFDLATSESKDVTKDFTLLRNFIIKNHNNFELLVIPQLQKSDKEIVREAFKLYKNGKL
jgi:uncharacterized protein (TIGR02646 family)